MLHLLLLEVSGKGAYAVIVKLCCLVKLLLAQHTAGKSVFSSQIKLGSKPAIPTMHGFPATGSCILCSNKCRLDQRGSRIRLGMYKHRQAIA